MPKSHKLLFQIETKKAMEGGGRAAVRSTYATLRLTHPNLPVELRDFQVVGWTLDCLASRTSSERVDQAPGKPAEPDNIIIRGRSAEKQAIPWEVGPDNHWEDKLEPKPIK